MVELLADAPAYIEPKIALDRTRLAVDPCRPRVFASTGSTQSGTLTSQ
jgi:hypothetical protein